MHLTPPAAWRPARMAGRIPVVLSTKGCTLLGACGRLRRQCGLWPLAGAERCTGSPPPCGACHTSGCAVHHGAGDSPLSRPTSKGRGDWMPARPSMPAGASQMAVTRPATARPHCLLRHFSSDSRTPHLPQPRITGACLDQGRTCLADCSGKPRSLGPITQCRPLSALRRRQDGRQLTAVLDRQLRALPTCRAPVKPPTEQEATAAPDEGEPALCFC